MRLSDFAWAAVGLVLLFGFSAHLAVFDVQMAGLILVGRGAAGALLGAGPRGRARGRARVLATAARSVQAIDEITTDPDRGDRTRVSLNDLLVARRHRRSAESH